MIILVTLVMGFNLFSEQVLWKKFILIRMTLKNLKYKRAKSYAFKKHFFLDIHFNQFRIDC